jgi:hypothetical protein
VPGPSAFNWLAVRILTPAGSLWPTLPFLLTDTWQLPHAELMPSVVQWPLLPTNSELML